MTVAQNFGERFSYTFGISVNNINAPTDREAARRREYAGFGRQLMAVAGADWRPFSRFAVRPAIMLRVHAGRTDYVAGSEFCWGRKDRPKGAAALIYGIYSRSNHAMAHMAGVEIRSIRITLATDNIYSTGLSDGSGALELSLRYTAPALRIKPRQRSVPCSRF